jgi:hypothetical protein
MGFRRFCHHPTINIRGNIAAEQTFPANDAKRLLTTVGVGSRILADGA